MYIKNLVQMNQDEFNSITFLKEYIFQKYQPG